MTGEARPDGMTAPVHLRLAGMALALGLAGCASVSGTNGGDAASTGTAAGKGATSSAASASAATSAASDAATSAAGDALKAAGVPTGPISADLLRVTGEQAALVLLAQRRTRCPELPEAPGMPSTQGVGLEL